MPNFMFANAIFFTKTDQFNDIICYDDDFLTFCR